MNRAQVVSPAIVMNKIIFLRDENVMLDRDPALLSGVKSIRLREQVKRNIARFPQNFMFQLTKEEVELMVSQNAIPSKHHLGGYLPYAFTEHGILMLANVLKSKRAIQMSIRIIEISVKLRKMDLTHKDILLKLEKLENEVTGNKQDIKAPLGMGLIGSSLMLILVGENRISKFISDLLVVIFTATTLSLLAATFFTNLWRRKLHVVAVLCVAAMLSTILRQLNIFHLFTSRIWLK